MFLCWEAVAQIIVNRFDNKRDSWKNAKSIEDIIKDPGQFSGYQDTNYNLCLAYLDSRSNPPSPKTDIEKRYESIIAAVLPYYKRTKSIKDLDKVVLYYSPKSMVPSGSAPYWAKSDLLEEVSVSGIAQNDFRFYKYK